MTSRQMLVVARRSREAERTGIASCIVLVVIWGEHHEKVRPTRILTLPIFVVSSQLPDGIAFLGDHFWQNHVIILF